MISNHVNNDLKNAVSRSGEEDKEEETARA